jgi:hypothetical protein
VDTSAGLFECWPWRGRRNALGYGQLDVTFGPFQDRPVPAHRISLSLALGRPIAPGMEACHTCDNPPCVNPAHLFEGTGQENRDDMVRKGRQAHGSRTGSAKLTDEQVRAIRVRVASGEARSTVAKDFGIHQSNVSYIASGKTWRQVRP